MKKFLVVLLACVMIFGFATTALAADTQIKEFSDIADQSAAAKNAIMKLAVLGVIEGNEGIGGAFRPADNLTRAEFAKIVCYLTDNVRVAESLTSVGSKFSDVSTGNWYTGWVNAAAQSGYFVGDPGGTFRPNANITMQEVVTVSLRAAGYTDKLGSATGNTTWPANYVSKAMSIGVLDDVTFVGSAAATRADMAIICNEVLGINMVVHINNDIAYALALSDGTVDPDGFSEVYYISNETKREKIEETILHKAFDGQYYYLQVSAADLRDRTTNLTVPDPSFFDESNGWSYEDYDDSEIYINLQDQYCYEDDDFDEYVYTTSSGNTRYSYGNAESLASTYYITGGNQLSDLSGMQVEIIVIDDKEINFVNVYSSTVQAQSVYKNSNSNIVADGKTYRASSTMDVSGKVNSAAGVSGGVADLSEGATFGADSNGDPNGIQDLWNSSSDDDFPAKLYLDKDGRVYATKNYNAYNDLPFGIVDEVDSDEVVLKAQANDWKTTGSTGTSNNYTLDTDEPYVLIKDGEMIKADDLAENDVITYLGDNGAHFYYVSSPVEGEFTQQTSSKITVAGFGYRQVTEFHISDDGGEDFEVYNGFGTDPIDTASFGDSEIAIAYNFSRIDYIALNTASSKIIGVVTNADPDSVWNTADGFLPQYKSLTIYNSEGKEVKYTFTTNFRNAYNSYLDSNNWVNTDYSSTSSATGKFYSDYFSSDKTLEVLSREIQEGDIVQVTLDSNDNIKKLANYAAFDGSAGDDDVEATVKSSNNRITIKGNNIAKEDGTYTLPSDATVFNVTSDGGDYDDVSIKTVASTLSADFKAAKIVAFDTKSNGNINYLYILEGVSAYKFGIISGQGRDATDDYYTMNGSRVYNDGTRATQMPNLVTYNISGGDAVIVDKLAWLDGGVAHYLTNIPAIVSNRDSDYGAVVGTVLSYSSSTNALNVGSQMLYITSDSYLYDFPGDDTVSSPSGLRDKFVAVIYDDDFEVICVALLGSDAVGHAPDAPIISDGTVVDSVNGYTVTWSTADGLTASTPKVGSATVPNGTTQFTASMVGLPTGATVAFYNAGYNGTASMPISLNPANTDVVIYFIVTAEDGTTQAYYQLTVTQLAVSGDASVARIFGTPALGAATGTFVSPVTINTAITVPFATTAITASDITPTVTGATVTLYTDIRYVRTTDSVALTTTGTNTVYFTVTSSDGSVEAVYEADNITRTQGNTTTTITNNTTVNGVKITGAATPYAVTLPYGTNLSALTAADVVVETTSPLATVGDIEIAAIAAGTRTITVTVISQNGGTNDYVIVVSVSAAPASGLSQAITVSEGTTAGATVFTFAALGGNGYALNPTVNAGGTAPAIGASTPAAYSRTLTSGADIVLNGPGVYDIVEVDAGTVVGFGTVTVTADEIAIVDITDVTIDAAAPKNTITPVNGPVTYTPATSATYTATWQQEGGGSVTAFVTGAIYETTYVFTARDNYVFADNVTVTVTNSTGTQTEQLSADGKTLTVVVTWQPAVI